MQKTDLNVAPYYDDFDVTDNFHRVLFRPFAVQARELTTLQSILQNQVERHGRHMFKEGSLVVPGQFGYINEYYAVKLQSTFNSVAISQYLQQFAENTNLTDNQDENADKGVIITGGTSGVKARVIGYSDATTTDPATLYVKYTQTATNTAGGATAGVTTTFVDGENISLILQLHMVQLQFLLILIQQLLQHLVQLQLVRLQVLKLVYILSEVLL